MRIADISIKQPVFITMIIAALVVIGGLSYKRLGVDLMPDISLPVIAVTVANPGVGPEEMESQVTKPIEDVLSTLNGLDHVTSTSSEGVSIIAAIFVLDKNPKWPLPKSGKRSPLSGTRFPARSSSRSSISSTPRRRRSSRSLS